MQKAFFIMAAAAMTIAAGCSKYDDSHLQERMETLEKTVLDLQKTIDKINSDMAALKVVTDAFETGDLITGIEEVKEGGKTIGYKISFAKSPAITVYNGTESMIGVKEDSDGILYWTINGEWLLHDGQKVRASGIESVVPKIRINAGNFEISYDGGEKWEIIGPAVSGEESGKSIFSNVEVKEDCVVFTLADGGKTFTIPLDKPFSLMFEKTGYEVEAGKTYFISYIVEGASELTVVDCIAHGKYEASVESEEPGIGKVKVTVPEVFTEGKVMVYADSKTGKTSIVTLYFTEKQSEEIIFSDTFDWANGTANTPGVQTAGEIRFEQLTTDTAGWTSEAVNGNINVWARLGCLRFSRTSFGGILVSPAFSSINGTADVTVTFKAARWNGKDTANIFTVQVRNAGEATQTRFEITNVDEGIWQENPNCVYTFEIIGATSETQIAFISADNTTGELGDGVVGRLLLDDVTVTLK